MKNIHASDFDIQQFSFDQQDCENRIVNHINSCEECRKRVDAYLLLSKNIKSQVEPKLDYDLAQLVLGELSASKEIAQENSYLNRLVILTTTSFVILTLLLFRDTFTFLINNIINQQSYFIISIAVFILFILVYDTFRTFNRKLEILNS